MPTVNEHKDCQLLVTVIEPRIYEGRFASKMITSAGVVEYNIDDYEFDYSSTGIPQLSVYCQDHDVDLLEYDYIFAIDSEEWYREE